MTTRRNRSASPYHCIAVEVVAVTMAQLKGRLVSQARRETQMREAYDWFMDPRVSAIWIETATGRNYDEVITAMQTKGLLARAA